MEPPQPECQPPRDLTGLRLSPPPQVAAGVPGVVSVVKKALSEPGLLRGLRVLSQVNQHGGFDCSSCAWPDPEGHRSLAEFCENGAKAVADEATTRRIGAEFFASHSVVELSRQSDYWLNRQGRLTEPLYLAPGDSHYRPISWEAAFTRVGEALRGLAHPDRAAFYTSGRTSNEAAFLYQLFVRRFGTNNLPDCSNMCHESSSVGLGETIGIGKGTVKLEDFYEAELILIAGQNPGTNHPRMLSALEKAKRNGARVVSINPLPEVGLVRFKNPQDFMHPLRALPTLLGRGTEMADMWLPVRLNGDVALFLGLCKAVLEREELSSGSAVDWEFIAAKTVGFEEFAAALAAESWDTLVTAAGVSREDMRQLGRWLVESKKIIVCWAMGLTQHRNAVANIQAMVNLVLLRGAIGKPGAGLCPVRGHSNVQGDRTMGITATPKPAFLEALGREFSFTPPARPGLDTVETIKAMAAGEVEVLLALGGNFLSATPDTEFTAQALRRCALTAQISTKLNRSHLVTGREALILPCLGRSEVDVQAGGSQFVTVENSMGKVHRSQGILPPASAHLKSETAIVAGIARATLGDILDWPGFCGDYSRIRERIENVVPGFEDYSRRSLHPDGFYLPNGPRQGSFPTASGRAHFSVLEVPRWELEPGQLLMMTIRSHDQFNTTVYGLDDRYRGIANERRVVLVNPQDLVGLGLAPGQVVHLVQESGGKRREARNFLAIPYPITPGCCATYFPETNCLVPLEHVADKSNTPASKSVAVRLISAGG